MFAEALEFFVTPAEPWARKLGYLKESIAIQARYRRHRLDWAEHLTCSRKTIEAATHKIGGGDTVVVLGAGSCLDVPIAILCAEFQHVYLVDAVHLRSWPLSRNMKVKRIVKDLTGVADDLMANSWRLPSPPAIDWFLDDTRIDLVVSANIASQLGAVPLMYLLHHIEIDTAAAKIFEAGLMQRHFQWLDYFSCPSVILCDAIRTMFDPDGSICSVEPLLDQMGLGNPTEKWDWPVAPVGEINGGGGMKTEVHVYCDRLPA